MSSFLSKKFQGKIAKLETVPKEDLDLVCIPLWGFFRPCTALVMLLLWHFRNVFIMGNCLSAVITFLSLNISAVSDNVFRTLISGIKGVGGRSILQEGDAAHA